MEYGALIDWRVQVAMECRLRKLCIMLLMHITTEPIKCHPNLHPYFQFSRLFSLLFSLLLSRLFSRLFSRLAEIKITNPKNNLSRNEVKALKELKNNPAIYKPQKSRQRDNNSYHEQGKSDSDKPKT